MFLPVSGSMPWFESAFSSGQGEREEWGGAGCQGGWAVVRVVSRMRMVKVVLWSIFSLWFFRWGVVCPCLFSCFLRLEV